MAQCHQSAHAGGNPRTPAQSSPYALSHYLRRVVRSVLLRAAVRGRVSWAVALQMLALVDRIGGAQ